MDDGDELELTDVADLRRISRQPGDVFVLTVPAQLTDHQAAQLQRQMEKELGAQCIVLTGGATLEVIGPGEPQA